MFQQEICMELIGLEKSAIYGEFDNLRHERPRFIELEGDQMRDTPRVFWQCAFGLRIWPYYLRRRGICH